MHSSRLLEPMLLSVSFWELTQILYLEIFAILNIPPIKKKTRRTISRIMHHAHKVLSFMTTPCSVGADTHLSETNWEANDVTSARSKVSICKTWNEALCVYSCVWEVICLYFNYNENLLHLLFFNIPHWHLTFILFCQEKIIRINQTEQEALVCPHVL